MGYIYLITNNINQKKYVGQTHKTVEQRWERHKYEALNELDNFYFHKAIRKYGEENFSITTLENCPDDLLDEKEIEYIQKYHTYYIYGTGYNLTRGGSGATKVNQAEILSQWNQGKSAIEIARYFGFYIRTITDVLKQNNISPDEIKSRSMKYGARFKQKKILQYDFSGNFINCYDTLEEMSQQTGYRKDYISAACRHEYPSANNYIWIYEDEEKSIEELIKNLPKELNHSVLQYDSNGNFIKEFPSYNSAAVELGCDRNLIRNAAQNISSTAKGYFWKDKNDPINIYEKIKAYNSRYNDRKKQVAQLDLSGNIIAVYESVTAAANRLGQPSLRSAISKVCQGKQKTSGGFKWKYID